jgi:hypothetical protein
VGERAEHPGSDQVGQRVDRREEDVEVGARLPQACDRLVDPLEALDVDPDVRVPVPSREGVHDLRRQVVLPLVDAERRVALDREAARERLNDATVRGWLGRARARREERAGERDGRAAERRDTQEPAAIDPLPYADFSISPSCHSGSSSRSARYFT